MTLEETRTSILDGAIAALSKHGLARLSLEDVAREAAVSRQTVYRYFGSRDALISATILREEETFIAAIVTAADRHEELRPTLEAAIAQALRSAREHPLLDRLLEAEPEALLPFLTTGRGPVLSAARPVIEELLANRLPHLTERELGRIADMSTRLIISYTINPPDDDVDDVAAGLADIITDGIKPAG